MTTCNTCDGVSKYYVGDIGTEIIVDTCVDISTATVTNLLIRKPDGTSHTWVGVIYNTQYIKYVVVADDFDQTGEYRLQAYVEMPSWQGRGDTARFQVSEQFG